MAPAMPCAYHPHRHADLSCPRCDLAVCRACLREGTCRRCAGEPEPGLDAVAEDSLNDPQTMEVAGRIAAVGVGVIGTPLLPLLVPLLVAGVALHVRARPERIAGALWSAAAALAVAFMVVFPVLVRVTRLVVAGPDGLRLVDAFAGAPAAALAVGAAGSAAAWWARRAVAGVCAALAGDDDSFLRGFLRGSVLLAWVAAGLCAAVLAIGT